MRTTLDLLLDIQYQSLWVHIIWLEVLIKTNLAKHQNCIAFNSDQPNKIEKVSYQIMERIVVIINSETIIWRVCRQT
jgi:hypothetical protein